MRKTMVTGVLDNQQPDNLEAGEGVYVTHINNDTLKWQHWSTALS